MKLKFFDIAKRLSKKSDHHRYRLGCVIVDKNSIIGFGYNQMKSHPKSPHKYKQIHAEFNAILGLLPYELKGSTMYVYREHKDGTLAEAKPCPSCQKLIQDCEIKEVFFTTKEGYKSYKPN